MTLDEAIIARKSIRSYDMEELEPELIAAKLMLLECGMVQCTAAQKGAVQLVAKDVGVISDDSGKPTEDTNTHKVRADRYVM